MEEFLYLCQPVLGQIIKWSVWFLGGCDGPLCTLLTFVVLNSLTGIMCALADRTLSGTAAFRAICQKALIFGLVGVGHMLDTQVTGTDSFLRVAVILFYLCNEGVAFLKKAEHLGLPIPEKLKSALEQLHSLP